MKTAHPHAPAQSVAALWQACHYAELNLPHLRERDIVPIVDALGQHPSVTLTQVGESCCGRAIKRLSTGHGPLVILAWTQMHGDEPTATAAVLDWLNILLTGSSDVATLALPDDWQSLVTLHIIPMLNPDGAERRTRINEQGIDINRDAKQLQSPEGRVLWEQVCTLKPDIAFNLHDQNPYYTAGHTENPATIAFLAPAFHPDKHVDAPRLRAKQLIACMADTISHWLPGFIGRYDDTYSLRSFGDNIAATGASTILIESGAHHNDPNRQVARQMNVIGLQCALEVLLSNVYQQKSLADYYRIPDNVEDGLTDLKFTNLAQQCHNSAYTADVSVNIDQQGQASISHIGDLSTQSAFTTIDASGMTLLPLKGKPLSSPLTLTRSEYLSLLSQGYCYFTGDETKLTNTSGLPVLCLIQPLDSQSLFPKRQAFWLMQDEHGHQHAVLNGQLLAVN